jgi:hypothetical protein
LQKQTLTPKTMPKTIILLIIILCMSAVSAHANQLHPVSGAYFTSETDLKVASRSVAMTWERTYRSNHTLMKIDSPDKRSYTSSQPVDGPLG